MIPWLASILVGGVAALDATGFAQLMLSQPLVTATLVGLIWGDPMTALQVGVVLQILAVSTQPIGARTPEDYASGGVVGAVLAVSWVAREPYLLMREASSLVGVLAGLLVALGGVPLIKWQRRLNEALARWCEDQLRSGREGALAAAHRAAVGLAFGIGVSYSAICLGLGLWGLTPLIEAESLRLARAWNLAEPLWLGLGLACVLQAFVQRQLVRGVLFAATLVGAWIVFMVGSS